MDIVRHRRRFSGKSDVLANKVIRCQSQKRMARWPKTNNGDEELYWKSTAFNVVLREACVFERDAPKSPGIRLWPVRRDESSRVLIGAAGRSRSDWRRRTLGALIGQSACRLLSVRVRAAIDSTRAGASGSL